MTQDKPKGGLGRGLGALIGPSPAPTVQESPFLSSVSARAVQESQEMPQADGASVRFISPGLIVENIEQPRAVFLEEQLDELTESIREHGILQPLLVTDRGNGTFELIAGERRLRASRRLGLEAVPVIIRSSSEGQDKLVLALIENIQRQDLNAVEEARAYKRLSEEYGLAHEDIARQVGKSRSTVTNAMRLLDLESDMLQALSEGKISKSHARTLLAEPIPQLRRDLFKKMLSGAGMTVRSAEAQAGARTRVINRVKDPNIAALETALRDALGTKVVVEYRAGVGKISVHFYSKEDLRNITKKMTGEAVLIGADDANT